MCNGSPISVYREWLARHSESPFPCINVRKRLASITGVSLSDVTKWFSNERKKYLRRLRANGAAHPPLRCRTSSVSPPPSPQASATYAASPPPHWTHAPAPESTSSPLPVCSPSPPPAPAASASSPLPPYSPSPPPVHWTHGSPPVIFCSPPQFGSPSPPSELWTHANSPLQFGSPSPPSALWTHANSPLQFGSPSKQRRENRFMPQNPLLRIVHGRTDMKLVESKEVTPTYSRECICKFIVR